MTEELKALEKLNHTICLNNNEGTLKFGLDDLDHIDCNTLYEFVDCYNTIEQSLKAFEIIKTKQVDLHTVNNVKSCREYNLKMMGRYAYYENKTLTEEEYDLLKEILK